MSLSNILSKMGIGGSESIMSNPQGENIDRFFSGFQNQRQNPYSHHQHMQQQHQPIQHQQFSHPNQYDPSNAGMGMMYYPYNMYGTPQQQQGYDLKLGYEHGHGGYSGYSTPRHNPKKGTRTALNALTLLAFLAFLNLLQNCLKEHMNAMNPTVMVMTAGEARDGTNRGEEFIVEPRIDEDYFDDNLHIVTNGSDFANNTNVIKITGISTSFAPEPKNYLINKNLT